MDFFATSIFAITDEITLGCFGGTRIYPTWHFGQMQGCIRSSWELRRSKLPWNCNFLRKMLTEAMVVKTDANMCLLTLIILPKTNSLITPINFLMGSYHDIFMDSFLGSLTENRIRRLLNTYFGSKDYEKRNYYWMISSNIDASDVRQQQLL